MTDHAAFMRRAVALVRDTQHRTSPNPTVGCVIVRAGVIVGEGVTRPVGQAHAEVVAIEAAGAAARGADMYVTLEPCSHHGRTPPCTQAILAAGLRSVFVGVEDPNPLVNGLGVGQLRAAGVPTEVGILAEPCARLAEPFRRFILDRRPWVLLKAAVTLDGRIAAASGDSKWITGEEARAAAHGLRARADAVLVGLGTAQADDPRLDVRLARGEDPLRVLLDSRAALDPRARMLGPGALVWSNRCFGIRPRGLSRDGLFRRCGGLRLRVWHRVCPGRGCLVACSLVASCLCAGGTGCESPPPARKSERE